MAFESRYWRTLLKKDIIYFEKKVLTNITLLNEEKFESFISFLEIKLFNLAFALRKLIESHKVIDKVANKKISITKIPRKDRAKVNFMTRYNFNEIYDFKKKHPDLISIRCVCNIIIHSYVFIFYSYRKRINSILLTSDYDKNKFLYKLKILNFLEVVKKFSESYPQKITMRHNSKIDDYELIITS